MRKYLKIAAACGMGLASLLALIKASAAQQSPVTAIDIALEPDATMVQRAQADQGAIAHLLAIIPQSFLDPFANGDLLQTLLISTLTGVALAKMGELGHRIAHGIEQVGQVFFRVVGFIVYVAPIGAFGAIAYTVGAFGLQSLINMAVNMGLLPTKGLTLPLMSYGGSSLLTVCALLGLILRVDYENRATAFGVTSAEDRRP